MRSAALPLDDSDGDGAARCFSAPTAPPVALKLEYQEPPPDRCCDAMTSVAEKEARARNCRSRATSRCERLARGGEAPSSAASSAGVAGS